MKVLIVEDEISLLELFVLEFELFFPEIECFKASNGLEALRLTEEHDFQLIITDGKMPVMSGVEFARKVKSKNRNTLLVLVTGYIYEYDHVQKEQLFHKIFDKPIEFDRFFGEVSALISVQP